MDADWTRPLVAFLEALLGFIPSVLIASIILVLGFVLSWLLGRLVRYLMRISGADDLLESAGAPTLLKKAGYQQATSVLLGTIVRWAGFLFTLVVAFDLIGLDELADGLKSVIAYGPRVLAASLVILLGVWAAGVLRRVIESMDEESGPFESTRPVALVVYYLILIVSGAIAAEQLGLEMGVINGLVLIVVGAIALAAALSIGIGSRETARNFVARSYVEKQFQKGDYVTVPGELSGIVKQHTATNMIVITQDGEISVPHHMMMDSVVWLDSSSPTADDYDDIVGEIDGDGGVESGSPPVPVPDEDERT